MMDWPEIYRRLSQDRNDPETWSSIQVLVRRWAQAALRQRGREVVEDVVADTCATVAINFHRAGGAETFRGFALGVFYNARRRALRASSVPREPLQSVDVAMPDPDEGPDPDDLAVLRMGLLALPARERKALMLRYFEDMSAAQIGAELGVSEVNARRIVCNGLARLRQHFDARARRGARREVSAVGEIGRAWPSLRALSRANPGGTSGTPSKPADPATRATRVSWGIRLLLERGPEQAATKLVRTAKGPRE